QVFAFKCFMICPLCGKALSGSASKGYSKYYVYYHCHSGCSFRLRAEDVNGQFTEILRRFVPKKPMLEVFKKVLYESWLKQTGNRSDDKKKIEIAIKQLEDKLNYGMELLVAREINAADFREIKELYTPKIERLKDKLRT